MYSGKLYHYFYRISDTLLYRPKTILKLGQANFIPCLFLNCHSLRINVYQRSREAITNNETIKLSLPS